MKNKIKNSKIFRYLDKTNSSMNKITTLEYQNTVLKEEISNLKDSLLILNDKLDKLNDSITFNNKISNENLFATIFHDSSKNSEWLDIPLSLSSWAIGYPYAYILFRILDEIKPKNILEMGMGQSTKIINEYVKHSKNIKYDIVEHDKNWIDFFKTNTNVDELSNIHLLKNYKREYNGTLINAYKNFKKEFKNYKFDFISIDGPVGSGQEYSRMDIIDLIPDCLRETFVILLDDCERIGEQRTIEILETKLNENGIEFSTGYRYWGRTSVYICVSKNLDFLCHI